MCRNKIFIVYIANKVQRSFEAEAKKRELPYYLAQRWYEEMFLFDRIAV